MLLSDLAYHVSDNAFCFDCAFLEVVTNSKPLFTIDIICLNALELRYSKKLFSIDIIHKYRRRKVMYVPFV
jgi:hypothetical protein